MKKKIPVLFSILFFHFVVTARLQAQELYFVSDTQQPLLVEKIIHKSNHNKNATANIFASILKDKPTSLYMLGDVVGLGYANKKWKKVDLFLDSCRKQGTGVCGVLGNHEVMGRKKKGEQNFQQRFPMNVRTGYVSVTDSVAVVLLNSNFNTLSASDENKQQEWYKATLESLDQTDSIKAVIVCCHHAPYSNSKVVKCSNKVQEHFVPGYIASKKTQLFITGHAHAFEHFKIKGKDFLVIGGGGGLHQRLNNTAGSLPDLSVDYKPMFHYLSVKRSADRLLITSHFLKKDFSGFDKGISFNTNQAENNSIGLSDEVLKTNSK
jgi:UDP-2,3-diacylglucosamine pyrophosphatase LpxH